MNTHTARLNMVQQQVRTWDVTDPQVLHVMSLIPRERFVLPEYQNLAFSDAFIPIGENQVALPPNMVGRFLQSLKLKNQDKVLEIGTGTGYITSLLSHLVKTVVSLEIYPALSEKAEQILHKLNLPHHIILETQNGASGFADEGPYDAIFVTGSLDYFSKPLLENLGPGGRIVGILGNSPAMSAVLMTRIDKDRFTKQILFETDVPRLLAAPQQEQFQF